MCDTAGAVIFNRMLEAARQKDIEELNRCCKLVKESARWKREFDKGYLAATDEDRDVIFRGMVNIY